MPELTKFFGIIVFMCAELGASHHKGIEVGHREFVGQIRGDVEGYPGGAGWGAAALKSFMVELRYE